MKEENKNEEIQSRREFFKSAAKKALPILGAITLTNIPIIANNAQSHSSGCTYCQGTCYGCAGSCKGTCSDVCTGCAGLCQGTCKGMCYNSAY